MKSALQRLDGSFSTFPEKGPKNRLPRQINVR
jgi:hypothetical protein